jgi:hypothetical protein
VVYFPIIVNHQEIESGYVVSWTGRRLAHSWMNWRTSSVDDTRRRPCIHLLPLSAAATEMFFLHASLYSAGAMSLGA